MNHDLFIEPRKVLESHKTVEKLRRLFGVQRKLCPVLLRIDCKKTDDLAVLKRKCVKLERRREIFPEMKLAQIVQIADVIAPVHFEGDGKQRAFPFARDMREIGFRRNDDRRFLRSKHLFQKFRHSGKLQPGILRRSVFDLRGIFVLDRIFCVIQTCRQPVRTESRGNIGA